jgi:acetolactate synthase small subunit
MQCIYKITAHNQPRMLARAIQLFDQQLLAMSSLVFETLTSELHIRIIVECDLTLAHRLVAKLHNQLGILSVELLADGFDIGTPDTAAAARRL